jgi:hypothetical protein
MKLKQAIFVALGELGDRTSLIHLQKRVEELAGKLPEYKYTARTRRLWRKDIAGGLKTDARTHADIPRRNMLNDQLVKPEHVASIFDFFTKTGTSPERLLELINDKDVKFHSLDQLVNAIEEMLELHLTFERLRVQ